MHPGAIYLNCSFIGLDLTYWIELFHNISGLYRPFDDVAFSDSYILSGIVSQRLIEAHLLLYLRESMADSLADPLFCEIGVSSTSPTA